MGKKQIPMNKKIFFLCTLFLLAGIAAGWVARPAMSGFRNPGASATPSLLPLPDVYQSTSYSCGASAVQSVLAYWGIEVYENDLWQPLRTTERLGTAPENMLRVLRSYGLQAQMHEGTTVPEIREALGKGVPVILDIQAWPDSPLPDASWDKDWEDGHYVIAIGIDNTNLYVEDPSLLRCRGFIPLGELDSRWRDYEGDPPYDASKRAYTRLGIFVEGKDTTIPKGLCRVN
jgi:predicted double-glycine peptidase